MARRKKKKDKEEGELSLKSRLFKKRIWTLEFMRIKAESTIKECESLIKKIDSDGIDAYYSENSDILRHATDIWKGCLRSAEFRKISEDMERE